MMKRVLALGLALSLPLAAMPAHANVTSMSYDARALSLGGSFSAWGNQDINSPLGNPALLAHQRGTFFLGPNFGLNLGNNAIGISEVQGITDYVRYLQDYGTASENGQTPPSRVPFPDMLPSGGVRVFTGTQVGLIGLKLGNFGIRSYARGGVEAHIDAPEIFQVVRNFDALDQNIAGEIRQLNQTLEQIRSSNSIEPDFDAAVETVTNIKSYLTSQTGLGPLMSKGANDSGAREVSVNLNEQAYVTTGLTYAQEIPNFGLPGKLTAGATVKLFNGLGTLNMPRNVFQTADGNAPVPVGVPGRLEMKTRVNVSKPLEEISTALDKFAEDPINNAEGLSGLGDSFKNVFDDPKSITTEYTSYAAGTMGTGLDLGLMLAVNDSLAVGGAITNAIVLWPGTKSSYTGNYDGKQFQLQEIAGSRENINFTATEPLGLQVGAAYVTPIPGLTVAADVQQSFDGFGPSLQLGAEENLFDILALRLGGRFGGRYSFVGGGLGVNLWLTRLDLAAAIDTQGQGGNVAASWSLGF